MKEYDGEFKGTTKQAIADLKEDIGTLKDDIKSLNHKFSVISILLVVAVIERLPTLISLVSAFGK